MPLLSMALAMSVHSMHAAAIVQILPLACLRLLMARCLTHVVHTSCLIWTLFSFFRSYLSSFTDYSGLGASEGALYPRASLILQFLVTAVEGSHHSIFGAYTIPPFRFQPHNRSIDWRRMSVLDVGRVTREMDVATLQENLIDITFCTLDREVCSHCSQPLDQALLNVLRLAQLSIQYLLHCQDFLNTRVTMLEVHLQASLRQLSQSQQELDCQAEELRDLRKEMNKQRKMIKDLQQLLQWSVARATIW